MRYIPPVLGAAILALSTGIMAQDPKPTEPSKEMIAGGLDHSSANWLKVTGKVQVINGYTIAFGNGQKVKLENGPEMEQQGKIDGKFYPAGQEAAEFLRKLIADREVTMYVNAGTDEYRRGDRVIGECYIGDLNLGTELVAGGWAIADHSLKVSSELIARQNKRGLWRGEFIPPQRWRKGERLPGEPAAGQSPAEKPAAKGAAPAEKHAEKPAVIRDEVPGSINHSKGTTWNRVIGKVKVLDANSIEFADGTRIELDITVPAPGQLAMNAEGLYPCGQAAAEFLRKFIGDKPVMCFKNDGDGPDIGYVGDTNLERLMVVNGWALADHSSLHADEIIARENKRGLWQGKFIHPDTWRAGVRLPGEMPPPKLPNEAAARKLFWVYGEDEDALPSIISRVVSEFPTLKKIHFTQRGRLTDDGLAQLAKLDQLEVLDIAGCGDMTNAGLAHLQAFPHLRELHLPHTISDSGLVHLEKLTELEKLTTDHWRGDPITDAGLAHLKKLRRIKYLVLNGLETTDAGLASLKELPDLAVLEFGRMPVGDAGLVHIGQLRNLSYLDISGTEVTDAGLAHLTDLKQLRVLKLPDRATEKARNELQRAIPELKLEGEPPK